MKNVYFVQPNNDLSGSLFLPYAVGTIAAYSFSRENVKREYCLKEFIFTKREIEDILKELDNPYIMAFSNYMWSVEYNLSLAEMVKRKFPDCIVVFGGVQIPDDTEYLEKYSFIDLLIHGEGEETFYNILTALSEDKDMDTVCNISYRKNDALVQTPKSASCSLEDYPSPYTMGLFDYIINDPKNKNIQFDAVVETNRGCPYGCIYCCWAGDKLGFRIFPLDRVKNDLKWMASNNISFCFCSDSNFGILERDEFIADYLVQLKKEYGYPEKFETTAAKNKDELVFRINCKLEEVSLNRGISLAVQSMSPKVLEIIGRKNMSVENFSNQVAKYRESGMYTYTDLILGLPGETLESFCRGLCEVIEAGQHSNISVYKLEFFPNTTINTEEFVNKYKIKTVRSLLCQNHTSIDTDMRYASRSNIVVETSTMSMEEWKKAFRFAICVQCFHSLGLLKFFAIYLRKAKSVSYYDFYMNLYWWIESESNIVKRILEKVTSSVDTFVRGEGNLCFSDERFGNIYWDFFEALFLCCVAEADAFFEETQKYLAKYFDDPQIFEDLFLYQKNMVALPGKCEKTFTTKYDWFNYFLRVFDEETLSPQKKRTTLCVPESSTKTWKEYARVNVWYGKRNENTINKPKYID